MNWFDAIALLVILASVFVGWRTGILKTAFTVSGMLLGYMLGTSDFIQEIFRNLVDDQNLAFFLSFLVPFTVTMVMARILWTVVRKTLQFVMLGWIDGAIGAGLGMVISALTLSVIMVIGCKLGVEGVITAMDQSIFGGTVVSFSIEAILTFVSVFGSDAVLYEEVLRACEIAS